MLLTEIILRLRSVCPIFERRVGGTASFTVATSKEGQAFSVPYCFVMPGEENTEDAKGAAVSQRINAKFLTIVAVDNSIHREDGNLTAADAVEICRKQIRNALLGWEPVLWTDNKPVLIGFGPGDEDLVANSRLDTFRYESGQHMAMNAQRLWHVFEWSTSYYDAPDIKDEVRGFSEVTLSGVTPKMIPPGATITRVSSLSGQQYPAADYTYDIQTGAFARVAGSKMPSNAQFIVWYEKPTDVYRKIYAAYYPEVLELAGGDPSAITIDMFDMVSEELPDGLVVDGTGFPPGGDA